MSKCSSGREQFTMFEVLLSRKEQQVIVVPG